MFPYLEGLSVEFSGALVGVGVVPLSHGLDVLSAVGVQEQNHRVVLDVVQPLHCSGRDVQQGMLVLGTAEETCKQEGGEFSCCRVKFEPTNQVVSMIKFIY